MVGSCPGLWTCQSLVTRVLLEVPDSHPAWAQVLSNLSKVPISWLQRFGIYVKRRGFHGREAGPAWEMQKTRALAAASLGMQRSAGGSGRGLDHLLLLGVGKEQHIQPSRNLQSLFSQRVPMDPDLEFAVDALVIFFGLGFNDGDSSRIFFECST